MRHNTKLHLLLLLLFCLSAAGAWAQCPGPANRQALINLQRSNVVNGTRAYQLPMTDTCGNQRYVTLDSLINIIQDSVTANPVNWYTTDDTTTDATRAAYVLQNATWTGVDPNGYLSFTMGDVSVGNIFIDATETNIIHSDVSGFQVLRAISDGIELTTALNATKSILMNTDTVNWLGRFDATNFHVNFLSDYSYMYADSNKVVGIGQFPEFPSIAFDGTDKGFYYGPNTEGVYVMNGDGLSGSYSYSYYDQFGAYMYAQYNGNNLNSTYCNIVADSDPGFDIKTNTPLYLSRIQGKSNGDGLLFQSSTTLSFNGNLTISSNATETPSWSGQIDDYALGVNQSVILASITGANVDLTGIDASQWEGRLLFLLNRSNVSTITLKDLDGSSAADNQFNLGTDYVIQPQRGVVLYYGLVPGDYWRVLGQYDANAGINWYNSDDITTDNTRIADVLQKAIWRSDDVTADGIYPFVFQLAGASPNEPEMMTWLFPNNDSLTLSQSDQEIVFTSSNRLNVVSANELTLVGDSLAYQNLNGTVFKINGSNSVTQGPGGRTTLSNQVTHASGNFTTNGDAQGSEIVMRRSITGTAETELFLDGSSESAILAGTNRVWTGTVKCTGVITDAGNATGGLSAGEVVGQWQPFTIKRIGATTTLLAPTFGTTIEGWTDTNMAGAQFNITADDANESLQITFVPPTLAGTTTVSRAVCTVNYNEVAY